MHRYALFTKNAVTFALLFVITNQAANRGKRIILEKNLSRFVKLVFLKKPYNLRNRSLYGTPLHALGIFALQAAVNLIHYV